MNTPIDLAARALGANPFTSSRAELDLALMGGRHDEAVFDRALERVGREASALLQKGGGESAFRAYLFALFHRHRAAMQALIAEEAASDAPKAAPFARGILRELAGHGVPPTRAERLLSLFFQTERAFLGLSALTGPSRSMQALRASLWNAVFTHDVTRYEGVLWDRMEDFSTLLLGETGTGKGAAASALAHAGLAPFDAGRGAFLPARAERLVAVNLAEVPDTLVESALFGHEKGAFTGADRAHEGIFSRVPKHGVVFLDELGDVPLHVQVKLLRVLQDRVFTPLGSKRERRFLGRLVAATHRPLDELRREGRFRDDLYYRLSTEAIVVAPLRVRIAESDAELPALVATIVQRTLGAPDAGLAAEVLRAIERDLGPAHPWPGNVRELEQRVRQVLMTGRMTREAARAPAAPSAADETKAPLAALLRTIETRRATGTEVLARYVALLHAELGSYEAVAKIADLDRRTVKKHVLTASLDQKRTSTSATPTLPTT